jgi:alanyl aminopeptidase
VSIRNFRRLTTGLPALLLRLTGVIAGIGAIAASGAIGAAAALADTPPAPQLRLPEIARPAWMLVDLTLLPEEETFAGKVGIELELLKPVSFLWLNGHGLTVEEATLTAGGAATPAAVTAGGEDFLGFDFGREIPAGRARLDIRYRGKVDAVETEGIFRQKDGENWYIYTQFESTFARRAFPSFDEPDYRVPWQLTLHVRNEHVAVANMPIAATRPEANGMKAVEFAPTPAISSYLVAFGAGPFGIVDAGSAGVNRVPIRILVPKGHESRAAYAAQNTAPIIEALEAYFGTPYPFPKLDNLSIPETVGFGAMENPGLITYADRSILADPAKDTLRRQQQYAEWGAHENAHQWFGDLVTMKWWDDIWLNEGFATWMAQKIVAEQKPEWGFDGEVATRRSEAMGADSLASSQPVRRPIKNQGDIVSAFDGISYQKGGALLSMYEAWMGPEKFRDGIRGYLKKHAWDNATSDDFLAALAVEGGPEVRRSFAAFLDQPGVPVVKADLACTGERGTLKLEQRRYVPLGSPVSTASRWPVPVQILYGKGDNVATRRTLLEEATGTMALDFCPEWIQLNDGGVGYYISQLPPALFQSMAARATTLPIKEQIAFVDDTSFLFGAGDLAPELALGVVSSFADSPNRRILDAAIKLALSVDDNFFEEKLRGNYERFLRATFGARARALGFAPNAGESFDETLLRPGVLVAVADHGADPELRAEARRLADRWLADGTGVSPEMLGAVMRIAAREGDAAFFDRLVEAAAKSKDRLVRRDLLGALGRFRDPAAVGKAIALLTSSPFDVRETMFSILWPLAGDRVTRDRMYEWLKLSYDQVAASVPEQYTSYLVYIGAGYCDEAHRAELRSFFGPRYEKVSGGPNNLAKAEDLIGICMGRKARQGKGVEEFLASY